MQLLFFILFYPLIWVTSKLNFRALYVVSDLLFYFIYYVLRYRRKTGYNNLKMVFPDKKVLSIKDNGRNYEKIKKISYSGSFNYIHDFILFAKVQTLIPNRKDLFHFNILS